MNFSLFREVSCLFLQRMSFVKHLFVSLGTERRGYNPAVDGGNHIGAVVYKTSSYGLG